MQIIGNMGINYKQTLHFDFILMSLKNPLLSIVSVSFPLMPIPNAPRFSYETHHHHHHYSACIMSVHSSACYQYSPQRLIQGQPWNSLPSRLSYMLFGHFARMDETADARRILTGVHQSDWSRPVGRPYTCWMATLKRDLSLHNLTRLASYKSVTYLLACTLSISGLRSICGTLWLDS